MKGYLYFVVSYLHLLLTVQGDNGTESEIPSLESRTLSCADKLINFKLTLTCSGYITIPTAQDARVTNLSEVQVLQMGAGNHIQMLKKGDFRDLYNLDTLRLFKAQIRKIEKGAFYELDKLQELDLSYNQIDSLDMEIFDSNERLKYLMLKGNPLHQLTGSQFGALTHLTRLDLSHCRLTEVPVNAFKQLTSMQELHLDYNNLRGLDWEAVSTLNTLTHIFLNNNPWACDCHMRFLFSFLTERKLNIAPHITCTKPDKFAGSTLANIGLDELVCHPVIRAINVSGAQNVYGQDDDVIFVEAELGSNIGFECFVDAFPEPEITFLRDDRIIRNEVRHANSSEVEDTTSRVPSSIHYKVEAISQRSVNPAFNSRHRKLLTIYEADVEDVGFYDCLTKSKEIGARDVRRIHLNFTNIPQVTESSVVTGGNGKLWLWILIPILVVLLIGLIVMAVLIWRKRNNEQQQKYKKEMMEKFKDSEIVLNDTFSSKRKEAGKASTPLLADESNKTDGSIVKHTALPDITQEMPSSLSPIVFSPRPQNAELRRQFFARMENQPERPSSVMSTYSLQMPRQYSTLPYPQHRHLYITRPHIYANPKPTGSLQSLVYPSSGQGVRPMIVRQHSGPAYATMKFPFRERRPPSVSSVTSEPPGQMGYGYNTFPRNLPFPQDYSRRPTSPTESVNSTFSYCSVPNSVRYDSIGPRTTLDGGSNLSLNKLPGSPTPSTLDSINHGLQSPTKGRVRHSRSGSSTTPASVRGRDFFSFEPIPEAESTAELMSQFPSHSEIDQLFPKFQQQQPSTPLGRIYKRKKPPPMSAIPPRIRKPLRPFEKPNSSQQGYDYDADLDGDKNDSPSPALPLSLSPIPIPNPEEATSNIKSIIEATEGTSV